MDHYLPPPRRGETYLQTSKISPPLSPSTTYRAGAPADFVLSDNLTSPHPSYHRLYQYEGGIPADSSSPSGPRLPSENYPHPLPESIGLCSNDNSHYDTEYSTRCQQQYESSINSETDVRDTSLYVDDFHGTSGTVSNNLYPLHIPESANFDDMNMRPFTTRKSMWRTSSDIMQSPMSLDDTPDSASSASVPTPASSARFSAPWVTPGLPGKDAVQELEGHCTDALNQEIDETNVHSSVERMIAPYWEQNLNEDETTNYDQAGLKIYDSEAMCNYINCDHLNIQNAGQYSHLAPGSAPPMDLKLNSSASSQEPTVDTTIQLQSPRVASDKVRERAHSKRKGPGQYVCELCGDDFTAAHNLKNHVNSHNGIKPHACEQCKYRSCTSFTLKRHVLKKHGGVAASKCKRYREVTMNFV
ncbi:hypothetical protein VKT23_009099 [Stygiomarasmius scandens]|uniref:C2H2-type domain-containing protein n=1 Tax=Marasmiellus scandens TaxID=2682957 RepID=A0ABR1JEF5_9AGAR